MSSHQTLISIRTLVGGGIAAFVLLIVLLGSCGSDETATTPTETATRTVTTSAPPTTTVLTKSAGPQPTTPVVPAQPVPVPDIETTRPPSTTSYYAPPAPLIPQSPASAYYDSCADARQAGVAPLYLGEPGYRSGLDRDGDGVACDN